MIAPGVADDRATEAHDGDAESAVKAGATPNPHRAGKHCATTKSPHPNATQEAKVDEAHDVLEDVLEDVPRKEPRSTTHTMHARTYPKTYARAAEQ